MNQRVKLLFCTIFVLLLTACSGGSPGNDSDKSDKDEEEKVKINVESTQVVTGEAVAVFKSTAVLEADRQATVTTKTSGIILKLLVEEGDRVEVGDLLLVLESDEQSLAVKSTQANYDKTLNQLKRAELLLSKGLTNKESVDNLRYETRSLKATLDQSKMELNFTQIKAPFSGIVSKRHVKIGNFVQQNAAVYDVVDTDSLQAKINVPEHQLSLMRKELPVRFKFDALQGVVIEGKIDRMSPAIDPASGTFVITVSVDNIDNTLRPGLFAKADIVYDKKENILLLDKNAIITEDTSSYVYEIVEEEKVKKTIVELGYEMEDKIEIKSGLTKDALIVTTGKNNLTPESYVEIVNYND